MTLQHAAFLFDYIGFQTTVTSLTAMLDCGDSSLLREQVTRIRQGIGAYKDWILHDKGTDFRGDLGLERDPRYQNSLWGHWFLIVLSTFLRPGISLGYDWSKLSCVLHAFQWEREDIFRVFAGQPTAWLLKPNAPYQRGQVVEWSDPYWYWINPRCTYCGWLPMEDIAQLKKRLLAHRRLTEEDVRTQIALPSNISEEKASISKELDPNYWYERIPIVYQRAIEMMSQALDAGVGLFMVVSQEEGEAEDWETVGDEKEE